MSNVGRPRTGLPECPHCGSPDRDSNGQCACRNRLYRLGRKHQVVTLKKATFGCSCGWTGKSGTEASVLRHRTAAIKAASA